MNLLATAKNVGRVALMWTKNHSHQILMAGGAISFGMALYSTGKAAVNEQDILVEHKLSLDHAKEIGDKKEIRKVYYVTSLNTAKNFAKAAGWTILTCVCIGGAFYELNGKLVKVTAEFCALNQSYQLYRQRVIDDQGEEKDVYYLTGVKPKTVTTKNEETGEKVKTQVTDFGNGVVLANPYAFKFSKYRDDGERNDYWQKEPTLNRAFVLGQIDYLNDQLYLRCKFDNEGRVTKRGVVMLNELRQLMGQTQTTTGSVVGNRFSNGEPGCNGFIDNTRIIEGIETDPDTGEDIPCIYINPNVDGMIYDLLDKYEDEPFYPNYDISHGEDEWAE